MSVSREPWYINLSSATEAKVVQVSGDKYYMEISFNTAQTLDQNGKIEMGIRVSKDNWSNYDQTNDFSYKSGVVVLYNGEIVTGKSPY